MRSPPTLLPLPMSGFRSPLDAYREDLSRALGRRRLAAGDEFWIILATGLRRLSQAPARSRPPAARRLASALATFAAEFDPSGPSSIAAALSRFPEPGHAHALVRDVRGVAADAEEAGAVGLAREILTDLRELATHASAVDRGAVLLQLGRLARTRGELDAALDLLHAAGDIGRADGVRELVVREALGEAVVARTRGNYPAARQFFEAALRGAGEIGLTDVQGMSHQGLMIVAAESGDFDSALRHGWQAVSSARASGSRVAEMLGNLAHLCAKAGYDVAAMGGFSAALARTDAPRLRLPVLAGLATSAGRLGDAKCVEDVALAVAAEASEAFPFESSGAWFAISRARHALGDIDASVAAAEKAAAIARLHGYHEITHFVQETARTTPVPLAHTGLGVIKSLETWSHDPTVELVISSAPTD